MKAQAKEIVAKLKTWATSPEGKALIGMYVRRAILGGSFAALPWALPAIYAVTGTNDPVKAAEAVAGILAAGIGIVGTLAHSHKTTKQKVRTKKAFENVLVQRNEALAVVDMLTTSESVERSTPPAAQTTNP